MIEKKRKITYKKPEKTAAERTSTRDLSLLKERAYNGRLLEDEVVYVFDRIQQYYDHPEQGRQDIIQLLVIAGYAGAFGPGWPVIEKYRSLIEKFLNFPQDPFVTTTALEILCYDWDLQDDYMDLIKSFIKGVPWDDGMDVRVQSLCEAGHYMERKGIDRELLKMLLTIYENPQERESIRFTAYTAIAEAMGRPLPLNQHIEFNLDTVAKNPAAQEMILKAHQYLE